MSIPKTIADYLRVFGKELADRTVETHPALHQPGDPVSPRMDTLLRKPYPAQELAAMSVVKRWEQARAAAVIAECGTGKTLVALAAIHCHANGRLYTALALVPGHLIAKMAVRHSRRCRAFECFSSTRCAIAHVITRRVE